MLKRAAFVACLLVAVSCSNKEKCNDGRDNDGNGLTDCADPKCGLGALCGANGFTCSSDESCSACSGNGGASEQTESSCGDGFDNDCDGFIDCDDPDCQATTSKTGGVCDSSGHTCGAPDGSGHATCGGAAPPVISSSELGWIRFAESDYYVLGAFGSGYQEEAALVFQVFKADGTKYPGIAVAFTHTSAGGSFIGDTPDCETDALTGVTTCAARGVTDSDGRVGVVLHSGRSYSILTVRAGATAGGVSRSLVAGGFAVVGAKPSGAHLSLDCDFHNVPALTHHDCAYSNYCSGLGLADICILKMADRHGIAIGVPTYAQFEAEAGAVPPSTVSIAYDQTRSAADQTNLGHAVGYLESCNSPLPIDVAPLPGEPSASADWGCGVRTVNPRDGLVTMIAMVRGEEGFADVNLNGRYDPGEPFIDEGEPYVDANDNGERDATEWFLDLNGDGAYTGPNGVWNSDTVIWTQTRVLYTGYPVALGNGLFSHFDPAAPWEVKAGPPPTTAFYSFYFTDENLNPLTSIATYAASSEAGNVTVNLSGPFGTWDSIGASALDGSGGLQQFYCPTPHLTASCHSGPPESACQTSPCYQVWDVAFCSTGTCAFQEFDIAGVSITGARPGDDVADVSATIEGVTTTFGIAGTCVP